jgi:hypothetical protein
MRAGAGGRHQYALFIRLCCRIRRQPRSKFVGNALSQPDETYIRSKMVKNGFDEFHRNRVTVGFLLVQYYIEF